jgi:hypothetical protein
MHLVRYCEGGRVWSFPDLPFRQFSFHDHDSEALYAWRYHFVTLSNQPINHSNPASHPTFTYPCWRCWVTAYSNNSGLRPLLIWRTQLLHLARSEFFREARRNHLLRLWDSYHAAFSPTEGPLSRKVETQPDKVRALFQVIKATIMHTDKSRRK